MFLVVKFSFIKWLTQNKKLSGIWIPVQYNMWLVGLVKLLTLFEFLHIKPSNNKSLFWVSGIRIPTVSWSSLHLESKLREIKHSNSNFELRCQFISLSKRWSYLWHYKTCLKQFSRLWFITLPSTIMAVKKRICYRDRLKTHDPATITVKGITVGTK